MDSARLLFLIVMVITPSGYSETSEPECEDLDKEKYNASEHEALYFVPFDMPEATLSDEEFTWYKTDPQRERISTDKNRGVHNNGGVLVFLNLSSESSGLYTARYKEPSGKCFNYHVEVKVYKGKNHTALNFGSIENLDKNVKVPCPDPVRNTCQMWHGNLTWEKDFKPLQGRNEPKLWLYHVTQKDEGIYTCTCTWTYNNKVYNSSGSRGLKVKAVTPVHRKPEIISPAYKELFADEGFGIKLDCTVLCGTDVGTHCKASWDLNGNPFNRQDGYSQTTNTAVKDHSTAILTIEKVSAKDFLTEFMCTGEGFYETASQTVTLKRRESIIPLVIGGVCVLFFCALAAILVKCFAIDLALFFRPYFPLRNHSKDTRVYDAYVVYQMQSMDKAAEDTLCQFVTKNLPAVLEEKCGYRLFIHGRDDIPGEDHVELVEDRMKQSRRLMVILTPGSGSGSEIADHCPASPQISAGGGFDWQVGLHHVLVQREMSVILIQLGDTGSQGYTHLPPGLQHLIRKSAPLRWPEGSRGASAWNSRFWKRVRYLMPATPAKKCPQSAII
ncbi:interleukin-1 receptor-like 1 [Symphorus nematophorus]